MSRHLDRTRIRRLRRIADAGVCPSCSRPVAVETIPEHGDVRMIKHVPGCEVAWRPGEDISPLLRRPRKPSRTRREAAANVAAIETELERFRTMVYHVVDVS